MHGSYEALKYGTLLDGLADLTGGITESISIRQDPTTCGRMLGKLLEMTSIITCTVQPPTQQVRQFKKIHYFPSIKIASLKNANFSKYLNF